MGLGPRTGLIGRVFATLRRLSGNDAAAVARPRRAVDRKFQEYRSIDY